VHNINQLKSSTAEGRTMKILKTTTTVLISGLLITGAIGPAWAAPPASEGSTVAQASSATTVLLAATAFLAAPEFPPDRNRPNALSNRKPGHMYSAHDIVGDPQACIMGGYNGLGGYHSMMAGVPAL
jgi:hypothetical protein